MRILKWLGRNQIEQTFPYITVYAYKDTLYDKR